MTDLIFSFFGGVSFCFFLFALHRAGPLADRNLFGLLGFWYSKFEIAGYFFFFRSVRVRSQIYLGRNFLTHIQIQGKFLKTNTRQKTKTSAPGGLFYSWPRGGGNPDFFDRGGRLEKYKRDEKPWPTTYPGDTLQQRPAGVRGPGGADFS